MFQQNDIVKVTKDDSVTIAKVLDSTEELVLLFRDTGNVWLPVDEYTIEKIGATI